jgi:hypothetical protein
LFKADAVEQLVKMVNAQLTSVESLLTSRLQSKAGSGSPKERS